MSDFEKFLDFVANMNSEEKKQLKEALEKFKILHNNQLNDEPVSVKTRKKNNNL